MSIKVCGFFVSCRSVCEVIPICVDVVHVTTSVIVKHWNEIFLSQCRILLAPVMHVENVITYVNKSHEIDCPHNTSFDVSTTADPDPIDFLKSYYEIEGSTLFLLSMLKKNVAVFVSLLFVTFVFNFIMIVIVCAMLTCRFSHFIVNSIVTFYRHFYYFIYIRVGI